MPRLNYTRILTKVKRRCKLCEGIGYQREWHYVSGKKVYQVHNRMVIRPRRAKVKGQEIVRFVGYCEKCDYNLGYVSRDKVGEAGATLLLAEIALLNPEQSTMWDTDPEADRGFDD